MKKLFSIVFIISLLIICVSCKKKENNEVLIKKENNIPKKLIEILNTVDKIETEILKLKIEVKKTDEDKIEEDKKEIMKKLKEEDSDKEKEDEGGKKEENGKEKSQSQDKLKSIKTKDEKIKDLWTNLEKEVESIHMIFSDYKTTAIKDKANEEKIKQFEENLNSLTIFIANKDLLNGFILNNDIYENISYFTSLYTDYESEVIKLKFYVNQVYIYGLKDEWDSTLEGIEQIETKYSEIYKIFDKKLKEKEKPTEDDKKKEKDLEILDVSIHSLKQSLNKKDIRLLEIKKDVVISNLEKLKD